MAFCLFLIVTAALLQCHRTVAPSFKNLGGGRQITGGMKVNSEAFSGSINDADYAPDFTGDIVIDNAGDIHGNGNGGFISGPVDRGTYNYHFGDPVPTNEDADPVYAAAKAEKERAEAYADEMSAKCDQPHIQNNYRLRRECYAKRDQAYAERRAARLRFDAVKNRSGDPPPSSGISLKPASSQKTSLSKKPSGSSQPSDSEKTWHPTLTGLWLSSPGVYTNGKSFFYPNGNYMINNEHATFNGKGNGGYHTNGFDASTTNYFTSSSSRPGRSAAGQQQNLHGFSDDASEADVASSEDTVADSHSWSGTSNSFNNHGNGDQIFTGAVFNAKPFSGNHKNIYNDNGDTYKVTVVDNINDKENCVEHWEIGLNRRGYAMWEPSFDVKCNGKGTRPFINTPDKVIVSDPDDSFCLYSNTQDSMTVIQEGTCTKFQYDNEGVQLSNNVLSKRDCDKEKEVVRKLLSGANKGSVISNVNGGFVNMNDMSSNTGEHAGDGQSFNIQHLGNVNYFGTHYTVSMSSLGSTCQDKIKISHNVENGIQDEFIVPCASSIRNCIYEGEEVLVGSPEDKFCAFSMFKMPKVITVIQDGKCKKRTFTDSAVPAEWTLKDSDCTVIKDKIRKIDAKLKARRFEETPKIKAELAALENDLAKKLDQIIPAVTTNPSKLTKPSIFGGLTPQTITKTTPEGGTTTVTGLINIDKPVKGNGIGSLQFTPQGLKYLPLGFGGPEQDLMGTSGQHNNYGNEDQNYAGMTINSGANSGDRYSGNKPATSNLKPSGSFKPGPKPALMGFLQRIFSMVPQEYKPWSRIF